MYADIKLIAFLNACMVFQDLQMLKLYIAVQCVNVLHFMHVFAHPNQMHHQTLTKITTCGLNVSKIIKAPANHRTISATLKTKI